MTQIGLMQLTVSSLCYFNIGSRTGKIIYSKLTITWSDPTYRSYLNNLTPFCILIHYRKCTVSIASQNDSGYPHDGRADKSPIRNLIHTTAIISALS